MKLVLFISFVSFKEKILLGLVMSKKNGKKKSHIEKGDSGEDEG